MMGPEVWVKDAIHLSMRTSEIKYICSGTGRHQEMYDLVSDPAETTNVCSDRAELAKFCYTSIQKVIGSDTVDSGQTTLTPRELERLRSLGYAGGQVKPVEENQD